MSNSIAGLELVQNTRAELRQDWNVITDRRCLADMKAQVRRELLKVLPDGSVPIDVRQGQARGLGFQVRVTIPGLHAAPCGRCHCHCRGSLALASTCFLTDIDCAHVPAARRPS